MQHHPVVSHSEWLEARKRLLEQEKQLTRQRDELTEARRALPWERVAEPYVFERTRGTATLADLFDGRSQLAVYHFMFGADDTAGCKSCSFWADGFNGIAQHLAHRDVSFVAISRGPLAKLLAYKQRLGWSFEWVSSASSTFNRDYAVSFSAEELARGKVTYNYAAQAVGPEMPGISVFCKDADGAVFHTYSSFGRGIEVVNPAYQFLDMVPKGRDEDGLPSPMAWLRRHDEYGV